MTDSSAKCLSLHQPWPELIFLGRKRYELRSWRTGYRGRLWLHAGRQVERRDARLAGLDPATLPTGALVGSVNVVDCVPYTPAICDELHAAAADFDPWEPDLWAWVLEEARRLSVAIPMSGKLGLFSLPADITSQIAEAGDGA